MVTANLMTGMTASLQLDSTSDPALVLDNDDDNDGVADVDDAYPRNASLQSNRDLERIGDEFIAKAPPLNGWRQTPPAVSGLSDGSFVVTWEGDSPDPGLATDIIGQRYANDGSKLGSEFLVNTTTIDYQTKPAVAGLASGGFVVVWESEDNQDGNDYEVYGQRFTSSGAKNGEEFQINTFTIEPQLGPAVAGLVNGGFVVTWESQGQDGFAGGIFGQRYAIDGAKLGNEFSVNTTTEGYQEQTLITALKRGGFVVTWISYGDEGSVDADIYGQRYAQDGARSGEEFKVNTSATIWQRLRKEPRHSLSGLQDGGFVATWARPELGGSDIDVFGQRFTAAGSPSGIEFQINTYKSADQTYPFVTGLSEGGFVVTWNSDGQDAGNDGVYGQYFAGNGMPSGDEFKVNRVPLESHSLSSSIGQDDGSFLVFWTTYDSQGGTPIYGQRYEYSAGFLPCNDYCVQTEDRMLYRFALRSEAETFPFFQDMTYVLPERPFGAVGGAFDFELNGEFITYATTDDDGNVQSDQYFVERSAAFAEAIRAGDNSVTLRLAASRSLANGIWLDGLAKKSLLSLGADDGFTVDQLSVRNRYARISRVEEGTGSEEEGQCNEHGMNDYAEGIGYQFLPNNPIEGGARSVFYQWGQNILLICSDTPVGVYPLILQIIDGRGGKIQTELVIEVLEERVAGGKVEWFPSKPGAEGDSDGDGVADSADAFPNDPAASVDTDGDGKPDDWNEGKSAADSTSDPALVLDDDDDNDGVKDINDDYPLDPARTIFDIDSDGVRDALDNCPNIANADQLDLDGDGDGDVCDTNRDGDSCPDAEDAYPSDPARCEKGLQKAIVVAGGGPYRENFLWEATERMAELAITTLRGQGIPREQILYLSAGFGKNDVPDGPATLASIEAGIIDWAGDVNEPADDVLLYLVDHGGPETFELAKKTLLSASELDGWLDTLQANTASKLVVVYDACQSGSFIPALATTGDQARMLMMSSGADERAHFAAKGDISFSFHFWSNFLVGGDLYRSFLAGNNAIEAVFDRRQNAELEVDGDGQANSKQDKVLATAFSFGSGIALASDTPEIGRVSEDIVLNGETKVRIEARDVSGASPIVRVWALVQSPDQIELAIDEPLINTEILELTDADGDGNWEGVYQDAKIRGAYEFQLFAANEANQYSAPKLDQSNRVLVTQKVGRTPLIGRDSDQDGVLDIADAFPLDPLHQLDLDGDMLPDGLDPDADGDGVRDAYNGPDRFEGFDTVAHSAITIADLAAVKRSFHADNDEDYLAFFGIGDETVTVRVTPTADQISGPDLIVSILDDTGAVYIQDGKKLTADNELQGDAEDLRFTPTESGRYLVQVSQARLAGATSFVTGAQSEYEISITADRRSVASTDLAISLNKQRYQAQESAWEQRLAASGVSDNDGLTKSYLMLPGAITPVGFDEAQCEFSRRVLTCTLDQAGDLARPVQLVAAGRGRV